MLLPASDPPETGSGFQEALNSVALRLGTGVPPGPNMLWLVVRVACSVSVTVGGGGGGLAATGCAARGAPSTATAIAMPSTASANERGCDRRRMGPLLSF